MEEIQKNIILLKINQFNLSDFKQIGYVENGSNGGSKKILIQNKETNKMYEGDYPAILFDNKLLSNVLYEMKIYSQLNHPSIKKLLGYSLFDFEQIPNTIQITEHLKNGTLSNIIFRTYGNALNDTLKQINIYGIASAMSYLHSKDIIHRDLKLENIHLDEFLFPKIGGFYLAKYLNDLDEVHTVGTPIYMAPEIWEGNKCSKAIDVYAFSMIMYQIFEEKEPFSNMNNMQLAYLVAIHKKRPKITDKTPEIYKRLIVSCWNTEIDKRPTFEEIVNKLRENNEYMLAKTDKNLYHSYIEIIDEEIQGKDTTEKRKRIFPEYDLHQLIKVEEEKEEEEEEEENVEEKKEKKEEEKEEEEEEKKEKEEEEEENAEEDRKRLEKKKINLNDYEKIYEIESNDFENVYLIRHKKTHKKYETREIKNSSRITKHNFFHHLKILSHLNHPSIQKFIGYSLIGFDGNPKIILVTENIINGHIERILEEERKGHKIIIWNSTMRLINIYGIASSMKHLHSQGIIHGNLNPNNVLVDKYLHPKLAGFDNSIFEGETRHRKLMKCEEVFFTAPEILRKQPVTNKCDVYSFAMIVYEIVTGKIPFDNSDLFQVMNQVINEKSRPTIGDEIPKIYQELIESCWDEEPSKRPTFDDIVNDLKTKNEFITSDVNETAYRSFIQIIDSEEKGLKSPVKRNLIFPPYQLDMIYVDLYNRENIIDDLRKAREIEKVLISLNIKQIEHEKYKLHGSIGSGGFGTVQLIEEIETQKLFALKQLNKNISVLDFFSEIKIQSQLNHPSILKLVGYSLDGFGTDSGLMIVTEFVRNGNLQTLIDCNKKEKMEKWTETLKLIDIYGIASALSYMHSKNILHLDIKPLNILIDDFMFVKVCDFGLSAKVQNDKQIIKINKGTFQYLSPEILNNKGATKKSDVYSFGILLYELKSKYLLDSLYRKKNQYDILIRKFRPKFDSKIPVIYQNLISKCWSDNPDDRPTFQEIVDYLKKPEIITSEVDAQLYKKYINIIDEELRGRNMSTQINEYPKHDLKIIYINKYNLSTSNYLTAEFYTDDDIDLTNPISGDSFSSVYSCIDKKLGKKVTVIIPHFDIDIDTIEKASEEAKELLKLKHPAIRNFIGFSFLKTKYLTKPITVNEYFSRKTLFDIIEKEIKGQHDIKWNSTKKLINIYGIASALLYLNSLHIPHSIPELKNVFVDKNYHPKLSEIGFYIQPKNSQSASKMTSSKIDDDNSANFPAEMFNEKSDVYAFGIIAYQIIMSEFLFDFVSQQKMPNGNLHLSFNERIPKSFQELIKKCVANKQEERPPLSEIVAMLENDPSLITDEIDSEFEIYKKELMAVTAASK